MTDFSKKLIEQFSEPNRYNNFGPVIRQIYIDGFRGIKRMPLKINFPITVISGTNGAGKSTIGQIAICGYKKPEELTDNKRQYIMNFFPISKVDPNPISEDAKIIYSYETTDPQKPQLVTISRVKSAWSGYKRQPERSCSYIGFTVYIPKVERRDLSIYGKGNLEFTEIRNIEPQIIVKMSKIIGYEYNNVIFQGVSHKKKISELGIATRLGYSYSENNMGFGEGRVLYIIDKLENSPDQSLFIIEEPETSLHASAQHELAKYLLDVCYRKHHQIFLSTHSNIIINVLPPEARKLITRDKTGVRIVDDVSSSQMDSVLSGGFIKSLDILVEDNFAKTLLTEIIRKYNKNLLDMVEIFPFGDKRAIAKAVEYFRITNKKAIGIRDADTGENPSSHLYKFPGSKPPEIELYSNKKIINFIDTKYGINTDWIISSEIENHHHITKTIAKKISVSEDYLLTLLVEEYANSPEIANQFKELIENIQMEINS